MSDYTLLSLNKTIPRNFLGRELVFREYPNYSHSIVINCVSTEVMRHKTFYGKKGRGYDLHGEVYVFDMANTGSLYHAEYPSGKPSILLRDEEIISDVALAHKWIHDNVAELIDLGYEVALMNGNIHPNDPEEIVDRRTLKVEELLKLETVLEYNVLYTIVK